MKNVLLILILASMCISCKNKTVKDWTDSEIEEWFQESKWSQKLNIYPDASIDKRAFVEQNILNAEAWEVTYQFLEKGGFDEMELGKVVLDQTGTYANVEEYMTKDSSHFEAHRKYIDIQYLALGKEYIRVSSMDNIEKEVVPYSKDKDIEFFDKTGYEQYLLDGSNFIVLFPHHAHMPCMQVDSSIHVRKVVVKIPLKK